MGAELAPHGRWYNGTEEHKGMRFRRVTTCLNQIAKPQLEAWKEKQVWEAVENVLGSVTPIASINQGWIEAAQQTIKKQSDAKREAAANFGTTAHELLAQSTALDAAALTDDTEMQGVLSAWQDWRRQSTYLMGGVEITVFDPELKIAGTIDWMGYDQTGAVVIGDYKTGGVWPEAAYQLAAYAYILRVNQGALQAPDRGVVVHLDRDGTFEEYEVADLYGAPMDIFLATVKIANAEKSPWIE